MKALWPLLQSELVRLRPLLQSTGVHTQAEHGRHGLECAAALSMAGMSDGIERATKWLRACYQSDALLAVNQQTNRLWLDAIFALINPADAPDIDLLLAHFEQATSAFPLAPQPAKAARAPREVAVSDATENSQELQIEITPLQALFVGEAADKTSALVRHLLMLEQNPDQTDQTLPLMRAAHSLKGAARAVGHEAIVSLVHSLEDKLSLVQKQNQAIAPDLIQIALEVTDYIQAISANFSTSTLHSSKFLQIKSKLDQASISAADSSTTARPSERSAAESTPSQSQYIENNESDPVLRVRASTLNKLIKLSGVQIRQIERLEHFNHAHARHRKEWTWLEDRLIELKSMLASSAHPHLDKRPSEYSEQPAAPRARSNQVMLEHLLEETQHEVLSFKRRALETMEQFTDHAHRMLELAERQLHTANSTRLRPLDDLVSGYHRLVRDVARKANKRAQLSIEGGHTLVDRDLMGHLDTILAHLITNAIDHGVELPEQRLDSGKVETGSLRLHAAFAASNLRIELGDDGGGIDLERVRGIVAARQQLTEEEKFALSEATLIDAILQPGFSTKSQVTTTSGRGVGLDAVNQAVRDLRGNLQIKTTRYVGTNFVISLPTSRAITRCLTIAIASDVYAIALLRIEKIVCPRPEELEIHEGLQYWRDPSSANPQTMRIPITSLSNQLELGDISIDEQTMTLVILKRGTQHFAFALHQILGEYDLAIEALDARLGRVADLAGVSQLPDGRPVVLIDADELVQSAIQQSKHVLRGKIQVETISRRRILVVDDSISVRELQRQLLELAGFDVQVAVDGAQAWNMLREYAFDLLITDVDMPRLDGIALTKSVKQDIRLKQLPVVIVSYRDRDEDRERGLQAKADAYLTKSDFQNERFLQIVRDLLGIES